MRLDSGLVNVNGWIHIRKTIGGRRIQETTKIPYKRAFFQQANQLLERIEKEIHEKRGGKRKARKTLEGMERYIEEYRKEQSHSGEARKERTVRREKGALDNIARFVVKSDKSDKSWKFDNMRIGDIDLADIRKPMLVQFINTMREAGRLNGGINRDLAAFKRVLNKAADDWFDDNGETWINLVPKLPSAGTKGGRIPFIFSHEDERKYLAELPSHIRVMWLFAIHTGARRGEVESLRWEWFKDDMFIVPARHAKMGRDRYIVLDKSSQEIVRQQRLVDPLRVFSKDMFPWTCRGAWGRSGLPSDGHISKGTHNCRKTYATRLGDARVPKWVIRAALGHRGEDVTDIYLKPTLDAIKEAVEAPYLVGNWCDREPKTFNPLIF